ncbi:MAG: serine--tRNA ligase [Planctomycetota bacterium]
MLDPRWVRDHPDEVKEAGRKKHLPCSDTVDEFLAVDRELRVLLPEVEGLRAEQRTSSKAVAAASSEARPGLVSRRKQIKERLVELSTNEKRLKERRSELLLLLPNIPAPDVPEGLDDSDNLEIRRVGEPPAFDFEARDHVELGQSLDIIEIPRAARISGTRNYFLKGDGVVLEEAVLRLAFEHMLDKGFVPLAVPLLVRDPAMVGTAYFPGGEEQAYRLEKDGLNLIGTGEVPVTSFHTGEILDVSELPKLYVTRSACFRREAGTYGKDTKGLYRVHQFHKVEQVIVDVDDAERSLRHHHEITRNAEELLELLGLPYRVVNVCGGDLGQPQVQKFDIETWMPSRNGYGETHSASRFHDFQARRLEIKYRGKDGRTRFCHTLNNTVVASPRILIAILENCQRADGSVEIPEALRGYMGKDRIGG